MSAAIGRNLAHMVSRKLALVLNDIILETYWQLLSKGVAIATTFQSSLNTVLRESSRWNVYYLIQKRFSGGLNVHFFICCRVQKLRGNLWYYLTANDVIQSSSSINYLLAGLFLVNSMSISGGKYACKFQFCCPPEPHGKFWFIYAFVS